MVCKPSIAVDERPNKRMRFSKECDEVGINTNTKKVTCVHSCAEMQFLACVIALARTNKQCASSKDITVDDVIDVAIAGDEFARTDGLVELKIANLVVEYDEFYWHKDGKRRA